MKYVIKKAPSVEVIKVKDKAEPVQPLWEYIPAVEQEKSNKKKSKSSHDEPTAALNAKAEGNEWVYVPAASENRTSKHSITKVSSKKSSAKVSLAPSYRD